jgi:2-succinyl-5-enolpyruvyl-6-hydroxy-3-cyclohexene-1-carboxylate synthase
VTVQGALVATFVDEWVRAGVRHAVVAPGSRSAPLALALLDAPGIEVVVRLDERSAAFACLGIGLATGAPAVLCTTSGTAAAEAHAAVVEADLAGVPMIVCTADRPVELQRVGAPQTIDQRDLYGRAVRSFVELGPALSDEPAVVAAWRSIASRAVLDATSGPSGPGPVHLNLPMRDPLLAPAGEPPPGRPDGAPWHRAVGAPGTSDAAVELLQAELAAACRILVVAGGRPSGAGSCASSEPVPVALARRVGGVVLADPRAWPRAPSDVVVAHADAVLRSARAREELAPDLVLHVGAPHASKAMSSWWGDAALSSTRHALVDPWGRMGDPERRAGIVLRGELAASALAARDAPAAPPAYLRAWRAAEAAAGEAIRRVLAAEPGCTEPAVARELFAALPAGSALVVGSSMPVRDLEWFAEPRPGAPTVLANRGANGIDGVVSTALGVAVARASAAAAGSTAALVGDLAFFHDLTALVHGVGERVPELTLVVVDNRGGGIFSFLPYSAELDEVRFERAFGTPQAADPAEVAAALGHRVSEVDKPGQLSPALAEAGATPGLKVIVVHTERAANAALHARLAGAAAVAVDAALARRPGG